MKAHSVECFAVCRKRRSPSAGERAEDYEGEWSDVETRCSVAIEGHAAAKYVRTMCLYLSTRGSVLAPG